MKAKKNDSPLENWEQEMIFKWIRANQIRYPKLQLAYATLNGVRLSIRLRAKMKKQGLRKGVLDIAFPFWSFDKKYCGLKIELKRLKGGSVTPEQKKEIIALKKEGRLAVVCKGHRETINMIKTYLGVTI